MSSNPDMSAPQSMPEDRRRLVERADLKEEIEQLKAQLALAIKLIKAIEDRTYLIYCNNVDGENWFDARYSFLKESK